MADNFAGTAGGSALSASLGVKRPTPHVLLLVMRKEQSIETFTVDYLTNII